jgi:hypothetical protein
VSSCGGRLRIDRAGKDDGARRWRRIPQPKGTLVTLLIVLLILALIFGGIGLLVEAAAWALIIAVALLIAGVVAGVVGRNRSTA